MTMTIVLLMIVIIEKVNIEFAAEWPKKYLGYTH